MKINIKPLHKNFKMPKYAVLGSACRDIYLTESISVLPYETVVIKLGFAIQLPPGWEMVLRPRSSVSIQFPNYIANSPGTIDYGYLDEVGLIFRNNTQFKADFREGDRICQMKIQRVDEIELNPVSEFDNNSYNRGGGFGSTDR